jgi:hypothetical protein
MGKKIDLSKAEPALLFGVKLGLILKKNVHMKTVQYVIVKTIKPVKEMMVRYGTTHISCAKDFIVQRDPKTGEEGMIMLDINCGLFGLDSRGNLKQGLLWKNVPHPQHLLFDGFRGIEMKGSTKYTPWYIKLENGKPVWTSTNTTYTYYPYKESLIPVPDNLLLYEDQVLIEATEAIDFLKRWLVVTKIS